MMTTTLSHSKEGIQNRLEYYPITLAEALHVKIEAEQRYSEAQDKLALTECSLKRHRAESDAEDAEQLAQIEQNLRDAPTPDGKKLTEKQLETLLLLHNDVQDIRRVKEAQNASDDLILHAAQGRVHAAKLTLVKATADLELVRAQGKMLELHVQLLTHA